MAKRKRGLTRVDKLLRSDGALCATFVNTDRREPLASYEDLLAWGVAARALSRADSRLLAEAAAEDPARAAGVFRRARALRDRLEHILSALAAGNDPTPADLRPVNFEVRTAMAARQLGPAGRRWTWRPLEPEDVDRVLWPVVASVTDVLTTALRDRVRLCASQDCGQLFVVRNASGRPRKWCGPACRSRHSSRSFYQRKKSKKAKEKRLEKGAQQTALAGYDPSRPLVRVGGE